MARKRRPWFRFYVEAMRDPKMHRLNPTQRWVWVAILSAARESYFPPFLMIAENIPYTWADLARYADVKLRDVETGTAIMHELGMIEFDKDFGAWFVPKWSERQYESDDVTVRVKRFRERHSNVSETADVTPPETETESETETPPNPPAPNGSDSSLEALLEEVWKLYAKKVIDRRAKPPDNDASFRSTIVDNARRERREQVVGWLGQFNVSADQLAAALIDGVPSSWNCYKRPTLKVVPA